MDDAMPFAEQIAYGSLSTSAPLAITPPSAISALLSLLELTQDDVLVDLGSGTGRVLIAAQKSAGARVIGYETDASLVEEARGNLSQAGIKPRDGHIIEADLHTADLSEGTVVFSYLVPRQQAAMRKLLQDFLKAPGRRRVVTYEFPLDGGGWPEPVIDAKYPIYVYSAND
jgi:protein-L-isoaspartate O-methyltransferase